MRRLTLAFLLAAVPASAGKRYAQLAVDPVDKTGSLSEPFGLLSTAKTYFERESFHGGAGWSAAEVHEGERDALYAFTAKDVLSWHQDDLEVLDEDFGRVAAVVTTSAKATRLSTRPLRRDRPRQTPRATAAPAATEPQSFALVRVFEAKPRFLVVSADYGLDGELRSFHVAESSGEWSASENGRHSTNGFDPGDWYAPSLDLSATARLGLPLSVDPKTFAATPFKGAAKGEFPLLADIALVYRNRGLVVDRTIKRGSKTENRTLYFPPTIIERSLMKAEKSLPFAPADTTN